MTEKSPAFQFYPKDWLSDLNVLSMSLEERGMYIHLLSICWIEGYIPNDPKRISILLGLHADYSIDECNHRWEMVKPCFQPHPNDPSKLVHPRLEKERKKQVEWREKSSLGGKASAKSRKTKDKSGGKGGLTVVQPKGNSSSSSSSSSSNNKNTRGKAPPRSKNGEVTDTTKAIEFWKAEYTKIVGCEADTTPGKDQKLMKFLISKHGFDEVMLRIPRHIAGGNLLSIGGFKTKFNDLTGSTNSKWDNVEPVYD